MKNHKRKKLTGDLVLFAIGSFGTKFLAFFLVPFYTNFLSTEEYGTIDLLVNTASLLLPVFTLCVYDSVMRFTIADKENRQYLRLGCAITGVGAVALGAALWMTHVLAPRAVSGYGLAWIWLLFACNAIFNLFTNYVRAVDRVAVMMQGSILNSLILLTMNIWLIARMKMGVSGYLISTVAGLTMASLYMALRCRKSSGCRLGRRPDDRRVTGEMLAYCAPLVFNAVAWWLNSSLDRYFVTAICGVSDNGIYSVAYKIPNLLTSVQTVFTQAWSISAITEFDREDRDGFIGETYELFSFVMVLACSGIMLLNEPLSNVLYAKEFFAANRYVPYLLVAALFSGLGGYFGGIFAAVKNSRVSAASTVISAVVNLVLNILLIPAFQVSGAAVATMISYFCAWLVRAVWAKRFIRLKVDSRKMIVSFVLLLAQMVCAVTEGRAYPVQLAILLLLLGLYRRQILHTARFFLSKCRRSSR